MPEFKPGQVVQHKLQKEWVFVLFPAEGGKVEFPQYICRTKKFEIVTFYAFELEVASRP